jgi:ankyrin repeat protein
LCLSWGNRNQEVAQMLLERGADPNARYNDGRDTLYMALKGGHTGLVQLLLKYGANPHTRGGDGETLLHVSSRMGDRKVAQGLLELGADINSRDNEGRTPLQVALQKDENGYWERLRQKGKEEVVQLLLEHGTNRA